MDPAVPISRGVSEGIEVKSFAGEVPDFDGDYVVEEPRTAEVSVVGSGLKLFSYF
jgi:hypothetical protein